MGPNRHCGKKMDGLSGCGLNRRVSGLVCRVLAKRHGTSDGKYGSGFRPGPFMTFHPPETNVWTFLRWTGKVADVSVNTRILFLDGSFEL